jgi:hypothetical protein
VKLEKSMPLTGTVSFQTALEKGNRLQIPKLIQWQFKMERSQVLRVGVYGQGLWKGWQFFYARMDKQGRILIPKLTLAVMTREENPNLAGYAFEVTIEPA